LESMSDATAPGSSLVKSSTAIPSSGLIRAQRTRKFVSPLQV
jgi:hypothetical protein